MDRFLARLERRLGKYAIEHLTWVIVGGMAAVFLIAYTRPSFIEMLTLDLSRVAHGQVWRLFTYIFIPRSLDLFWVFFSLYWLWLMGTNLENEWGAFKFNAYYFVGMLGTTVAALVANAGIGNFYLNVSLTFAFATVFPDYQLLLMLVIPVRIKWVAWLAAAYLVYEMVVIDSWAYRAAIVASVANYLLFFGPHLWRLARGRKLQLQQAARRDSVPPAASGGVVMGQRTCAICGAREADGADIRVCACEKCGGQARNLCLEHARSH
jgi:membrane associated rhomboid family serine protease